MNLVNSYLFCFHDKESSKSGKKSEMPIKSRVFIRQGEFLTYILPRYIYIMSVGPVQAGFYQAGRGIYRSIRSSLYVQKLVWRVFIFNHLPFLEINPGQNIYLGYYN